MVEAGAGGNLAHLLKVLNTSKVMEDRIWALDELAILTFTSNTDELSIAAALTTAWQEDSASIICDCKWRTSICRVASVRVPLSQIGSQTFTMYVQLATKAIAWWINCCSKVAVLESKTKGARQDVVQKLLAETNALSMATLTAALDCSYLLEKPFIASLATLISEALSLVKVLCFWSTPMNDLQVTELHKVGVDLLGSVLRLIKVVGDRITDVTVEALQMVKSAMEAVQELGELSAKVEWGLVHVTGRKNILVLNITWKFGVAMLTPTDRSPSMNTTVVDIESFITLLISHGMYSLKLAAEVWLPKPSSPVATRDARFRKHCILVKFFYDIAAKVCAFYPKHAIVLRKIIVDSILKVSTLLLAHSGEATLTKEAVKQLCEVGAPQAFGLLPPLLSGSNVDISLKIQLFQCIGVEFELSPAVEYLRLTEKEDISLPLWDNEARGRYLPSRVLLFLHIFQSSAKYCPELLLELAKSLDWVVDSIAEEEVYATLVQIQMIPECTSDSTTEPQWQLMYLWSLRALETFCVCASASPEAWIEVQEFLFRYALQPCSICGELIKHLWCFIAKYGEETLIKGHISGLISLLRSMAITEDPEQQAAKRLARIVCALVQAAPKAGAPHLYSLIFLEDPFATLSSSRLVSLLLQEGFCFGLLDTARFSSTVSFLKHCLAAAKSVGENKERAKGTDQEALWCLYHLLNQSVDKKLIDSKQMQEIKALTLDTTTKQSLTSITDPQFSACITIPMLSISSLLIKQKVQPKTLQNLLVNLQQLVNSTSHVEAKAMKPVLAEFLTSLSAYDISEEESNPAIQALWYLYHTVLRERHWALVHAGLASFGHFAEQTPCNELWRFVPSDPGLASEVHESTESGADMFMNTLKSYLEKDTVCNTLTVADPEIDLLHEEAKKQRRSYFQVLQQKEREFPEEKTIVVDLDSVEVETEPPATAGFKKVSTPDEVKTAITMLQEGFSLLSSISPNWLSRSHQKLNDWQTIISQLAEVNKKLSTL